MIPFLGFLAALALQLFLPRLGFSTETAARPLRLSALVFLGSMACGGLAALGFAVAWVAAWNLLGTAAVVLGSWFLLAAVEGLERR